MGKSRLEKSEATNGQISSNTKCNFKQIVEKVNERPEWLPDGWNVDFRTRKSGPHEGSGYKCYIDPLNGYKFYSKPEVLRYLETIKDTSCTPKKETCATMHSPSNLAVEKSTVEDLPPGWIKEVKIRKNGSGIRKDLFYIDPVSGYVFRSKKDVLRYLESGDITTCAFKPTRRQIQDEDKFTPSPAAKRQKLKKSATKRRLFVGKEISDKNNLELPDANSSEKGQDVELSSGMMVAPVPTCESVVKMHSQEDAAANPPEMKKTTDPGSSALLKIGSLKESEKMFPAEAGLHLTSADNVQEKDNVVNIMENDNEKNHIKPSISKNKEEFNVPHRFSRRLAGVEPDHLANNVTTEQTLHAPKRNLRKSRTTLDADAANKSSQHFNGVPEIEVLNKINKLSEDQAVFTEQPHLLETEKLEDNKPEPNQYPLFRDSSLPSIKVAAKTVRDELPYLDNPHNSHSLASEAHVLKENKLHASEIGKSGLQETRSNSNKSSNKKEHLVPCRASKRLAGYEHKLMSNSISCEKAHKYKSRQSKGEFNAESQQSEGGPATEFADHAPINGESANKRRKPPKAPPSADEQLEKLEGEEMDDVNLEPQLSFAFHYSWSDPNLEFAINTLTGVLPNEDSVDNGPKKREDLADNGPTTVPETDIRKNNLFDNVTGSIRDRNPQVHSNKSKNKELKMPRRLSKRLAGLEPEVLPSERALEYVTRKSCKDEPTATAILTNGAYEHLDTGEETKLTLHASDSLKTRVHGESSNKSEKSYDTQTVTKEQLQKLEAENIGDERSEPQLSLPFGDSWSDPCLEFAIKTLTGALPVEAAADILPVMTPDVNDLQNKELLENLVEKSVSEEAHDNSNQSQNKNELNMVCLSSKQLLGQPELRTSSTSCENYSKLATRDSYSDEGNITRNLDGEPLHNEAGNVTLADHSRNVNTLIHEEPLQENGQVLEGEPVATEQPQLETETISHDNSESQFCASFLESWSDPCLEFAFKTLTGAIPVEENLAIQGCFQEPVNCHDQRDVGSTLPDIGPSSFSQTDISFHCDIGEKSIPGQQSSMSSTLLPLDKASLRGCTGVDPQKHYSQSNKNFQGR